MKNKIVQIVERLSTIVSCPVVVTGSIALAEFGIYPSINDPKDLDVILINPSTNDLLAVDILQKANPANNISCDFRKNMLEVRCQIIINNMPVDIFTEKHPDFDSYNNNLYLLSNEGVKLNRIDRILTAKKRMGRAKDWFQIMEIQDEIMRGSEHLANAMKDLGSKRMAVVEHITGRRIEYNTVRNGESFDPSSYINYLKAGASVSNADTASPSEHKK